MKNVTKNKTKTEGNYLTKWSKNMAAEKPNLLSTGAIAKELGVPGAKVTKAIKDLNLKPEMKKGVCSYYSKDVVKKIKVAIK